MINSSKNLKIVTAGNIDEIINLTESEAMERIDVCRTKVSALTSADPITGASVGNIGTGKSLVTKSLRSFQFVPIPENTEDVVLTDLYYPKRADYAQILQVHLRGTRGAHAWLALHLKHRLGLSSWQDRSTYEEPLAFMPSLHDMKNPNTNKPDLDDTEFERLKTYFEVQYSEGAKTQAEYEHRVARSKSNSVFGSKDLVNLETDLAILFGRGLPSVDVLVYMYGNRTSAWEQLQRRHAPYERLDAPNEKAAGLPEELHKYLHGRYEKFLKLLDDTAWYRNHVIPFDQDRLSITTRRGELFLVESLIQVLEERKIERSRLRETSNV